MYSNLTLYYLNQIGITPWISVDTKEVPVIEAKALPITSKLLLLTTKGLDLKERVLLGHMMFFLALPEKDTVHLEMNSGQKPELSAPFTVSFGLNKDIFSDFKQDQEITHLESLSYVLDNPSSKKKIYHQLQGLKNQLAVL